MYTRWTTIASRHLRLTQIPYWEDGELLFRFLYELKATIAGVQVAMAEVHGREDCQSAHRKGGTVLAMSISD